MAPEQNTSGQLGKIMRMEIYESGPITIAMPYDRRMDAACVIAFKATMHDISESGARHILLDMSRIEFMDSSGLGALIAVLKKMSPDRKFEVCGLTARVQKVFDLTRMDRVFNIYKTVEDAIPGQRKKVGIDGVQ